MHTENTIHIDAPPAVVWATTIDIERWPEWTPTVLAARRLDEDQGQDQSQSPLRAGSSVLLRQPGLPEARWTVTTIEPGRHFAWEARVRGIHFVASHSIEPEGAGTRNTLRVEATGWPLRLLGPVLKPRLAAALEAENRGLKARCEGGGGGVGGG